MAIARYVAWQLNRVLSVASGQECRDVADGISKLLSHYFVDFSFDECGDFDMVGHPYTGSYLDLISHRIKPPYRVVDALFEATQCDTFKARCGFISGKARWCEVSLVPFKYITEMPPHYVPYFRRTRVNTDYPYYTLFYKAEKSFASDLFKHVFRTIAAGRKADCIKTSRGPRGAASGYLKSYSGTRVRIRQLRKAINALLKRPTPFVLEVHGYTLGEVELKVRKALNVLKGKYSSKRKESRAPYVVTPALPYEDHCCAFIFSAGQKAFDRLYNYFVNFINRLRSGVRMYRMSIDDRRSTIARDFHFIKRVTQPVIFAVLDFIGRCNPGLVRRKWFTCSKDLLHRIKKRKINRLHHYIRSFAAWGMWLAIPRRLIEKGRLPTSSGYPLLRNGVTKQVDCVFRSRHVTDKYVYYYLWSDEKLTVKHSPYATFKNPDLHDPPLPVYLDMLKRARITQNPIYTFVAYGVFGCLPLTKSARCDFYYDFKPRYSYLDFIKEPNTYFDYLVSCARYEITPAPPPPITELQHIYAQLYVGYVLTCVHIGVLPLYTKFIEEVTVPPELKEVVGVIVECLRNS